MPTPSRSPCPEIRLPPRPTAALGSAALQAVPDASVAGDQFRLADRADGRQRRVQQRRRLGEDQLNVVRPVRMLPVIAELPADEHGEQIRGGDARGRVA
jgi:hypothetical protein